MSNVSSNTQTKVEKGVRASPCSKMTQSDKYFWKHFVLKIVVIAVLLVVFLFCICGLTLQYDDGMSPSLEYGDVLMYYRLDKNLTSGDVVVYKTNGQMRTGRIVGVAGDAIGYYVDGTLILNGEPTQVTLEDYSSGTVEPGVVPDGCYFIIGDNYGAAKDSLVFGSIPESEVKGRVILSVRKGGF